ncbi:reverse transcriptase domain-containing protein [Tanacetum coccineum]
MLVDTLLQREVEGRVDRLVDEVEELESKRAELVEELAIKKLQGLLPTIVAQVGDHISNQGINGSRNDNATDDNIQEDDRNVNLGNDRNGCSYKEFVACKPNELDGKGSAVAYIRWVEKLKAVQDISDCGDNYYPETKRIERYIYGLALQICGMVAATTPPTIQSAILKDKVLTDKNGSLKRTGERRGDGGESTKEGNVKGDNKRARNGKLLAIITNPIRKEYTGSKPKCTNCNFHHNLETPSRACMNCNRLGHFSRDCRARPRMVNLLNGKNPTTAHGACYECGGTDIYKSTCPRLNRAPGQGGNYQN